jgi:hypothetical protein
MQSKNDFNIILKYHWEEVNLIVLNYISTPLECHLFAEINNNKIKIAISELQTNKLNVTSVLSLLMFF